jgi:hypothetical protein
MSASNRLTIQIVTDYRGHHWKGITIDNDFEVNYKQKLFILTYKNILFDHNRKFKPICYLYIYHIKKIPFNFSELPSIYSFSIT